MKRIEKVSSLVGLELKKENGETFTFSMEDILDVSVKRIDGKTYSEIKLVNGFEVLYRNTLSSTFYSITEGEPIVSIAQEEMACAEEELDLSTIEFIEEKSIAIPDFYNKVWKALVTIENEKNICFGLVDENNMVHIPTSKASEGESCNIYHIEKLLPIVTETVEVGHKICDLNRNNRTFDKTNYSFTGKQDGKTYMLNKQTCDKIIGSTFKGEPVIGFVNGEEVIVPIEVKTAFFNVMSILTLPLSELQGHRILYKRYQKQKKTSGVTDLDYNNIFNYMSF